MIKNRIEYDHTLEKFKIAVDNLFDKKGELDSNQLGHFWAEEHYDEMAHELFDFLKDTKNERTTEQEFDEWRQLTSLLPVLRKVHQSVGDLCKRSDKSVELDVLTKIMKFILRQGEKIATDVLRVLRDNDDSIPGNRLKDMLDDLQELPYFIKEKRHRERYAKIFRTLVDREDFDIDLLKVPSNGHCAWLSGKSESGVEKKEIPFQGLLNTAKFLQLHPEGQLFIWTDDVKGVNESIEKLINTLKGASVVDDYLKRKTATLLEIQIKQLEEDKEQPGNQPLITTLDRSVKKLKEDVEASGFLNQIISASDPHLSDEEKSEREEQFLRSIEHAQDTPDLIASLKKIQVKPWEDLTQTQWADFPEDKKRILETYIDSEARGEAPLRYPANGKDVLLTIAVVLEGGIGFDLDVEFKEPVDIIDPVGLQISATKSDYDKSEEEQDPEAGYKMLMAIIAARKNSPIGFRALEKIADHLDRDIIKVVDQPDPTIETKDDEVQIERVKTLFLKRGTSKDFKEKKGGYRADLSYQVGEQLAFAVAEKFGPNCFHLFPEITVALSIMLIDKSMVIPPDENLEMAGLKIDLSLKRPASAPTKLYSHLSFSNSLEAQKERARLRGIQKPLANLLLTAKQRIENLKRSLDDKDIQTGKYIAAKTEDLADVTEEVKDLPFNAFLAHPWKSNNKNQKEREDWHRRRIEDIQKELEEVLSRIPATIESSQHFESQEHLFESSDSSIAESSDNDREIGASGVKQQRDELELFNENTEQREAFLDLLKILTNQKSFQLSISDALLENFGHANLITPASIARGLKLLKTAELTASENDLIITESVNIQHSNSKTAIRSLNETIYSTDHRSFLLTNLPKAPFCALIQKNVKGTLEIITAKGPIDFKSYMENLRPELKPGMKSIQISKIEGLQLTRGQSISTHKRR